jgi:MurNAc alpha-1-phosphate uridylyltransferase
MNSNPETTSIFILAAGRGERMRPLTDHTPKPLLKVSNKSLIEYHLDKASKQGFKDVVINVAHLSHQIIDQIGNGERFGLDIKYSDESRVGALETAGGIIQALDLIKHQQFICLNADIWTDFDYASLLKDRNKLTKKANILAKIVLVKNPPHNLSGDFSFNNKTQLVERINNKEKTIDNFTFSGIGLYKKDSFSTLPKQKQALAPILRNWADHKQLHGIIHTGEWQDIGTPKRLKQINKYLEDQI